MREFQYIHAKGIPFFKDQKFDLSKKGISVILGLNTNSGKSGNSNFVGKSLFFSQIMETIAPNKEFSNPKDRHRSGFTEVGLKAGEKQFKIRRVYKSPEKLLVNCDGVEKDFHKVTDARQYVEKVVGHASDVLPLLMYLDNTRTHPIRTGDTGARRKFFTDFFNLVVTDEYKKLVKAEKDALVAKALVFEELKSRLSSLKAQRQDLDANVLRKQLLTAKTEAKEALGYLDKVRELEQLDSFLKNNKESVDAFRKHDTNRASLKSQLGKIDNWLQCAQDWDEYEAELSIYQKQRKTLIDYLEENKLKDFDETAVKNYLQTAQGTIKQAQKTYSDSLLSYERKVQKRADLEDSLKEAKTLLKKLKPEGECSACGQPVTNKHYKKEKVRLESLIEEIVEKLESLQVGSKPEEPEADPKVERYQRKLELWQDRPRVGRKPEKPDGLEDLPSDLHKLSDKKDLIRDTLRGLKIVDNSGYAEVIRKGNIQPLNDNEYEVALKAATKASDKVSRLESDLDRAESLDKEGADLSSRVKALSKELDDLEVLDVMSKAFAGDKAGSMKQIIISSLCDKLQDQVNKYARLLLPEDYTFEFDLQTQFSIIVSRKVGGKEVTSDVRKLSGAEAGCFNLILTMSLLTFVPPGKRPNILILDELNANFSAEMTSSLIRFLPTLNQVIPHIIIITPHTADNYGENVRYFTVIKKGSESRIVEGKHRTMPKAVNDSSSTKRKKAA